MNDKIIEQIRAIEKSVRSSAEQLVVLAHQEQYKREQLPSRLSLGQTGEDLEECAKLILGIAGEIENVVDGFEDVILQCEQRRAL